MASNAEGTTIGRMEFLAYFSVAGVTLRSIGGFRANAEVHINGDENQFSIRPGRSVLEESVDLTQESYCRLGMAKRQFFREQHGRLQGGLGIVQEYCNENRSDYALLY